MGESYRGLTIKIGADTTGLARALKAVESAASQTESELKKIGKALQVNPSDTYAVQANIRALGEKAQDSAGRLDTLTKAERQASDRARELADGAENVALAYNHWVGEYNAVDAALERLNRHNRKLARDNEITADSYANYAKKLNAAGLITDEMYEKYERLASAHEQIQATMGEYAEAVQLRDLRAEISASSAAFGALISRQTEFETKAGKLGKGTAALRELQEELEKTKGTASALASQMTVLDESLKLSTSFKTGAAQERMAVLKEQTKLATKELEKLRTAMKALRDAGADDAGKSMEQLLQSTKKATEEYEGLKKRIASCAAEAESLRSQAATEERKNGLSEEYERLSKEAADAKVRLQGLNEEAEGALKRLDTAVACKALRELGTQAIYAESKLKSLEAQTKVFSFANISHSMRTVGYALSSTVTPAIAQFGRAMLDSAVEVDSAYRDMRKTVNGTEEDFERLRQAALEYSTAHVTSASTLLEIEAMGGQLGIATDQLEAFATVCSNLDIATDLDSDEVSQQLGQLNNLLSWGEGDMERYGDALVRLGNNMPAVESAISDITTRIAAAASMVGMSTPEILAWSTAIAATGQEAESSGTAISNTLSNIETAVASGGDKLQKFADVAGMTAQEFKSLWATDPSTVFQEFVSGLADIEATGGSADTTLQGLGITGERQKRSLKSLATTVDTLSDALQMSQDAWDGVSDEWGDAGDAAREAERKSEGLSGTMSKLSNISERLATAFGDSAAPALSAFAKVADAAVETIEGLPDPVMQAVTGITALVGVAGPLSISIGAGAYAFDKLSLSINKAAIATRAFNVAVGASKVALAAFAVGVVADIVGQYYDRYQAEQEYLANTATLAEGVAGAYRRVSEEASGSQEATGEAAESCQDFADRMAQAAESARTGFNQTAEEIEGVAEALANVDLENLTLYKCIEVMEQLADQEGLTTEQQTMLAAAVSTYNSITGESVHVTDAENGVLSDKVDNLKAIADETANANKESVYSDQAASKAEKLIELEGKLQEAKRDTAEAQLRYWDVEKGADSVTAIAESLGYTHDELVDRLAEDDAAVRAAIEALPDSRDKYKASTNGITTQEGQGFSDLLVLKGALNNAEQAEADLQAQYDSTEESLRYLSEARDAMGASTKKTSDETEVAARSLEELVNEYKLLKAASDGTSYSVADAGSAIAEALDEYRNGTTTIDDATTAVNNALTSVGDSQASFTSDMVEAAAAEQLSGEQVVELSGRLYELEAAETAAQEAAAQAQEELEALVGTVGELSASDYGLQAFLERSGLSVEEFSRRLQESGIDASSFESGYQELAETIRDGSNLIRDAWDGTPTAEEYAANLIQNNLDFAGWSANIAQLREMAGTTGGEAANQMCLEFVDKLEELGPEYAPLVEEFLANPEAFYTAADESARAGERAAEHYTQGIVDGAEAATDQVESAAASTATAMTEGVQEAVAEADVATAVVDSVTDGLMELPAEMRARGEAAGGYLGLGLGGETALAYVAEGTQALVNQVADTLGGINESMRVVGETASSSFAEGVKGGADAVYAAGMGLSFSAVSGLRAAAGFATSSGYELGVNFAKGLKSAVPAIAAAAEEAGYAASSRLHFSEPTKGPLVGINDSGAEMISNYARSMLTQVPALGRASDLAARAASFAGVASSTARKYERTVGSGGSGITKAELFDALDTALRANATQLVPAVYVDGKRLAQSISGHMDAQLGTLETRRGR